MPQDLILPWKWLFYKYHVRIIYTVRYEGYKKWNSKSQNATTGHRRRAKWLNGQKVPKRFWHLSYYRGYWYLIKGKYVFAYLKVTPDFKMLWFVQWCRRYIKRKRKQYIMRDTFERKMQFFTAYWWVKERENETDEERQARIDDYTFHQLMRELDRDKSESFEDTFEREEPSDNAIYRKRLKRVLSEDS